MFNYDEDTIILQLKFFSFFLLIKIYRVLSISSKNPSQFLSSFFFFLYTYFVIRRIFLPVPVVIVCKLLCLAF